MIGTQTYFDGALSRLLGIEGGEVNDPADPGGHTRFGITEAKARRHGYEGPMGDLPLSVARSIYREDYWDVVRGDEVAEVSNDLAFELFEASVHIAAGQWRAGHWLQQLLNILNDGATLYDDIAEDGIIGPKTLGALRAFYGVRGGGGLEVIVALFNCLQGEYYIREARSDLSDERFIYGWALKRIVT